MDWFDVPHDKDRWWGAIANAVMTLEFHKMQGKSWPAEVLSASQERLC